MNRYSEFHWNTCAHSGTHTPTLWHKQPQIPTESINSKVCRSGCKRGAVTSQLVCLLWIVACLGSFLPPFFFQFTCRVKPSAHRSGEGQVQNSRRACFSNFFFCTVMMTAWNTSAGITPPSLAALLTPVILAWPRGERGLHNNSRLAPIVYGLTPAIFSTVACL